MRRSPDPIHCVTNLHINCQWTLYENRDITDFHIHNFLECVTTRNKPNADLETVDHPSSVLYHAVNVACHVGRDAHFDPQTEMFIDDFKANAFRTHPEYDKPWGLSEV